MLLLAMALVLLLTISSAWHLQRLVDEAADLRDQSSQRLMLVAKVSSTLRMAEAAQRGFLMTGVEHYLSTYERSKADSTRHVRDLRRRYASDHQAAVTLSRLQRWQEMRLEELDEALAIQRTHGSEYARILTVEDTGRTFMRQFDNEVSKLEALETQGNSALTRLTRQRRQATVAAAIAVYLVAAAAMFLVFRSLRRETEARKRLADQMEHDAFHDALTGLPNRRYLLDELNRSVMRTGRRSAKFGLLFIDLDGFKRVNDGLGHNFGDEVLKTAAARFAKVVRQGDMLARLGGDEFAVVFETDDLQGGFFLAERLLTALRAPLLEGHEDYVISASIGIAVFPDHASDGPSLLTTADKAMYLAKRSGKGRACHHAETVAIEPARNC